MSLQVVFLGTAGSVPTQKRSLPAIIIKRKGEQIMFDCGEGTQRQMVKAKTGFHKKMKVFYPVQHLCPDLPRHTLASWLTRERAYLLKGFEPGILGKR